MLGILANGWLSKFDSQIQYSAQFYARYMDDIIRNIEASCIENKHMEINAWHPSLKFTIERETDNSIYTIF